MAIVYGFIFELRYEWPVGGTQLEKQEVFGNIWGHIIGLIMSEGGVLWVLSRQETRMLKLLECTNSPAQ